MVIAYFGVTEGDLEKVIYPTGELKFFLLKLCYAIISVETITQKDAFVKETLRSDAIYFS